MDYRDYSMGVGGLKLDPGIQDLVLRALNPREPVEAKIGQDGQFTVDMFKKEKPKTEGGEKKPGEGAKPTTPQAGFGPAIAALTGPTGGAGVKELAGLTPDQIVSVMGMEAKKRQLEQGTIGQLLDLPYRQALTQKALRPVEQWTTLPPDAQGRVYQVSTTTGEKKLAEKAPGRTLEEAKELKRTATDIPRGDYWKNKEDDIKWVNYGEVPPTGYDTRVPSSEKVVSGLPGEKFEKAKATKASNARYGLQHPDTVKSAKKSMIHEANDGWAGTTLYVWDPGKGIFNLKGADELRLPPGMVADEFTPEMTEAIGRGETIYVTHPTLGDVALKRDGDSVVIVE